MKKVILIMVIISVTAFPMAAGAVSINQLSRDIAGCMCSGQGTAFQNGCRIYMSVRLQLMKTPDEAVASAEKVCEDNHTSDGKIGKCKEGVVFLRNKE